MAKGKIIDVGLDTSGVLLGEPEQHPPAPKVKNVKPAGSQILVEILTEQEMMGTNLIVGNKHDMKIPLQGYIKAVGPKFKSEDWGFDVGNRVLISGAGVPSPNFDNSHRDKFLLEPHAVKGVVVEG